MYERSAIVLERYFENLLEYNNEYNLKDNFNNYCELVEKLEKFQTNYQKELEATKEFNKALDNVKAVQNTQEKLYKKSAKLEYNRNLLFHNIEAKVEETQRCIDRIEIDIDKNNESMRELKEKLIESLNNYNDKRFELSKCKRYKKIAENAYDEALEKARNNFEGISSENVAIVKKFDKFQNTMDIIQNLEENGKGEKIPFNEDVMEKATVFGLDIAKKEATEYLVAYDKMNKILADIDSGTTRTELHKKYSRNERVKMDFIIAIKNYIVQFLDYERMTVIHGRKSHNRLMVEACENFEADVNQINNLYDLLLREVSNKATKKAYKELYNKTYLRDIQGKEERFRKEKNRVNLNTATLINTNYWRIEGIKEIYTVFYKNVSKVLGKDVAEFDLISEENSDDNDYLDEDNREAKTSSIIPFEIDSEYEYESDNREVNYMETEETQDDIDDDKYVNYYDTYTDIIDNVVENFSFQEDDEEDDDDEFDIFGEKYKELDFLEKGFVEKENNVKKEMNFNEQDVKNTDSNETEEEMLFSNSSSKIKSSGIEDFDLTPEKKINKNVLKKMRAISSTKRKKKESEAW